MAGAKHNLPSLPRPVRKLFAKLPAGSSAVSCADLLNSLTVPEVRKPKNGRPFAAFQASR
jgi:hypothetical protein